MNTSKKRFLMVGIIVTLIALFAVPSFAVSKTTECPEIKIIVDGKMTVNSDVPISVNGHTMLPLRDLLIKLGVSNDDKHITWNDAQQTIVIQNDSVNINLKMGDVGAKVNGKAIALDSAPLIYNGKAYIPVRFVAQALAKRVEWEETSRTITICDESYFQKLRTLEQTVLDAEAKLKNYHLDMTLNYTLKSGSRKVELDTVIFPLAKQKHELATVTDRDTSLLIPIVTTTKYESFNDSLSKYIRELPSGKWETTVFNESDYLRELGMAQMSASYLAGRVITDDPDKNEIVVEGYVTLPDSENPDFTKKAYSKIVFSKDTYYTKSGYTKITGTDPQGDSYVEEFTYVNGRYNDNVSFELPADIKK